MLSGSDARIFVFSQNEGTKSVGPFSASPQPERKRIEVSVRARTFFILRGLEQLLLMGQDMERHHNNLFSYDNSDRASA
jgi:hypothetical protein